MHERTNGKHKTTRPYVPMIKQTEAQQRLYREFAQWGAMRDAVSALNI